MSIFSQIAKNTIYQIFGKVIGTILGLVTIGLMTRYLGQTGYGHYTTIVAFLMFFGVLSDFGLQMTATQMLSHPEADEKKIFANIFTLRFFSSLIFLGLAAVIIWLMPYPSVIKWGALIATASFLFSALQSVLISIYQKNIEVAKVAAAEVWGRIVTLVGIWLIINEGRGLLWLIGAVVLGGLVNFLILYSGAKRYFSIHLAFDREIWSQIWHSSWPLTITIALNLVYFRADTVIMSIFRPQDEVGLYGATYKVLEVLIQMPYLFLGLVLPLLTKFFIINKDLFRATLQKSFDFLAIITIPMVVALIILGEKIMVFVAGPEFAISGQLLKILIFATAFIYLSALFGYAIVACGLQKKMIKYYLFDAIISLPLYLIFIPRYTYWAAAYLTVFTELIIVVSSFYVVKKYTGTTIKLKVASKALLASLVMALPLIFFININILWLVVIGLVVYFWVLISLRGFSKKTALEIFNIKET